jgi:hypothetical protein
MLVGRCSSQLSGHNLKGKLKKSQAPTRISYIALLETTTYATLRKERRRKFINATTLNRNSGGAKPRDLRHFGN